ncbi:transporter substrate-binding domain-containing protein [Lichenibacterium dinghuense]|uniref:transporter substrate-binding domain-containing protein n=1 Tax=Lichenibacterium dinghuense TaxID=2895977 RepID=UPI001F4769A8|nr:transporter substrate-binding domain-containing protein [Lichenibacterium sp. 6Y81]
MLRALGLASLLLPMLAAAEPAGAASDRAGAVAPTGTLRVGVVRAPRAGVFFTAVGPEGAPRGVTVDLGRAFAAELGVPFADTVYPNSGECTDAVASGTVDVAFMPVDPARSARVAFGPGYYTIESTYLVSEASKIATLAEVDRPGVRVVAVADTTTIRAAAQTLQATQPVPVRSVDEAVAMLRDGRADALALSRDSLEQIAPSVPGSHVLDGNFQRTTISIAVPPGRPAALAAATAFLDRAKRDGTVRRAFDAFGLTREAVGP